MGQKVNPISLRLQQTNREFDNCWYSDYFYKKLISRDIYLQQYVNNFLKLLKCPSARFSIQYSTKNSKLSSFLCYPQQSRMLRSRLFGISFAKNRKNNYKKTNLSSKRQKSVKFLINNRLWSRFFLFNSLYSINSLRRSSSGSGSFLQSKKEIQSKKQDRFFLDKVKKQQEIQNLKEYVLFSSYNKIDPLNYRALNNIYSTLLLRTYTNKNISTFKNYHNNFGYFILPVVFYIIKKKNQFLFLQSKKRKNLNNNSVLFNKVYNNFLFFTKKKQHNFLKKNIKYNKNNNLLHFLKRLITTLFFVRILKKSSRLFLAQNGKAPDLFFSFLNKKEKNKEPLSLKESKKKIAVSFLEKKEEKNKKQLTKIKNFNLEYRKNFLKFFLVFYILYTESNKNTRFFLGEKKEIPSLFLFENNKDLHSKKECLQENLLNSYGCFSIFQPNYIFHTTFQNKTPLQLLLQHCKNYKTNNSFLFLLKKKKEKVLFSTDFLFFSKKKNRNSLGYNKENQLVNLKYKNYIQDFLSTQFNINVEFSPFIVSQDWQSAGFLADEIVYFLERRVPFRRLKHKILKKIIENPRIRGVRISCSGRVGGKSKKAQRAKTECVKYGQTSRHTFSSRIDFAARTARTIFGSVGIKVWICYN